MSSPKIKYFYTILTLLQIHWANSRVKSLSFGDTLVYSSFDGTDCPINEPRPFHTGWFSHKFNGPGLRYEVGFSVEGHLVWFNGPFPCGSFPDLKIFKEGMAHDLDPTERGILDNGYKHNLCVSKDGLTQSLKDIHRPIRARYETVNSRLKNSQVLHHPLGHLLDLHMYCFHAVAQVTAMLISTSDPLFTI